MKPIVVLSLFDGMSCGYQALKEAGIPVKKYYASEICQHAIKVAKKNHPNIEHLGDVALWDFWNIETPDLIIGGSPCQGFSFVGKQLAFDDPRSKLFFTYENIVRHYTAKNKNLKFLLENVKMAQRHIDVITDRMGVQVMPLNSNLLSAQDRARLYWFNWDAPEPKDRGITTADVLQLDDLSVNKAGWQEWWRKNEQFQIGKKYSCYANLRDKAICMTARQISSWSGNLVKHSKGIRFITPIEAERLQTLPDNYTVGVSNTQRYKMIGNGWTVAVIAHLFAALKKEQGNA